MPGVLDNSRGSIIAVDVQNEGRRGFLFTKLDT